MRDYHQDSTRKSSKNLHKFKLFQDKWSFSRKSSKNESRKYSGFLYPVFFFETENLWIAQRILTKLTPIISLKIAYPRIAPNASVNASSKYYLIYFSKDFFIKFSGKPFRSCPMSMNTLKDLSWKSSIDSFKRSLQELLHKSL